MSQDLPNFRYHLDPLKTESIIQSDQTCECCGQQRGYAVAGGIYCIQTVETICPWCVADGSACKKFDGDCVASIDSQDNQISDEVRDEVLKRTPAFIGYQEEFWLCHCNDACQYQGFATQEDLAEITPQDLQEFVSKNWFFDHLVENWSEYCEEYYFDRNDPLFHKFACLHCQKKLYYADLS